MSATANLVGKRFQGDLYARKHGTDDPFRPIGNVKELSTKQEVETDELIGTGLDNFGQAISAIVTPKPIEVNIKYNSFDKHSFAQVLMGDAIDLQTKQTPFADLVAKVSKTGWVKLAHTDIDPTNFEIKNKEGQKVDKTHYELNERLGMVRFTTESTVTEGDNFTYTGKTKGTAGYHIDVGSLHDIKLEMYLDVRERFSGKRGILTIPQAVLASEGDMNWFGDEWLEAGMNGKLVKEADKAVMTYTEFD